MYPKNCRQTPIPELVRTVRFLNCDIDRTVNTLLASNDMPATRISLFQDHIIMVEIRDFNGCKYIVTLKMIKHKIGIKSE